MWLHLFLSTESSIYFVDQQSNLRLMSEITNQFSSVYRVAS